MGGAGRPFFLPAMIINSLNHIKSRYGIKTRMHYVLILIVVILFFACHSHTHIKYDSAVDQLQERIAYLIKDPNLFNAQIGIYIESLKSGEIIFSQNEHKLFISASNMKIYTTAAALLKFDPGFSYKTHVLASGKIIDGKLQGDLIIRGSGDPTITAKYHDGDVRNLLNSWVDSLIAAGITEISGKLIGDASYFQNPPLGSGWQWDDEPFWYAAQINALSINDNCVDVTVFPGERPGAKPTVRTEPTDSYVTIENLAMTSDADSSNTISITRQRSQNKLIIKNNIPINSKKYSESLSVEDPAKYFIHLFAEILADRGIKLAGNLETNYDARGIEYPELHHVFTHYSPPLHEIVTAVNKKSQNLYAEQLLLTLAAEYGEKASAGEGTKIVTTRLAAMGIPASEFRMQDGSGLSRKNLVSPYATGLLLKYMARHRYADYFIGSLPIGGVDGTLKSRMKGMSAAGKVYAKTGYVGYARNLSGYVDSQDNERFIFSILVNNYTVPTPAINLLQDNICNILAEFKR